MPVKRPFLLYLRSRLNIGLSVAAASLVVLSLLFLGRGALLASLLLIALYCALTALLFFSRRGAREIVAESEEDRLSKIRRKIDGYAAVRDRISVLRIGDEAMAKSLEYFLLVSGEYLQKCREVSGYSPHANERIDRVLEICQVFLGERDEGATGRRYGVQEGEAAGDPSARFSRAIMECASVIKERATEDLLGLSGEERLRIMDELEGGK